jgi:anti-sigma regulatory factor (Ser/Thr protein kinase)
VISIPFDATTLQFLRTVTNDTARAEGLTPDDVAGLVLAVNEIATNAITHGGGRGHLRLWAGIDRLRCQITDQGPGLPPGWAPPQAPPTSASSGRGMWLAAQCCHMDVHSTAPGLTISLSAPLPARDLATV